MRVAIIGAGRLGSLLIRRIPTAHEQVIIRRTKTDSNAGPLVSDQLSAAAGCQVVLLALPGPVIPGVLQGLVPHLDPGALVVNMATDVDTPGLRAIAPDLRIVAAKLFGHAVAVANGAPGIIVVDLATPPEFTLLANLLGSVAAVIPGSEDSVKQANTIVAEEMVKAEISLRARLEVLGLTEEMIRCAFVTTATGILRSLADGTAGPFVREVARRVRGE